MAALNGASISPDLCFFSVLELKV
jgi:uncharacterized membrane protein HdeD (DUF308 family)